MRIMNISLLFFLLSIPEIVTSQSSTKKPNFVFIISDDHRWDAIGAAGNTKIKTPVLDKLAREGVYFKQATIHVSQCAPSRATLLTGIPPHQNGYYSNNFISKDLQWADKFDVPTLPELLMAAGYETVLIGKWHVRTEPWLTGFSEIRTWLPDGGANYSDSRLSFGNSRKKEIKKGFTNGLFFDDAISFLNSEQSKKKPFLLWVASTIPHAPYQPNPSHFEHMYESESAEELKPPAFPHNTHVKMGLEGDRNADSTDSRFTDYYSSISYLDQLVGNVVETLENQGLLKNTILIFLGDNGFMAGSRGIRGKVVPWEESVRVPMIIYAPHISTIKGKSETSVNSIDIPPTILTMAGIKPPSNWPGRNIVPVLRGNKNGFDYAFSEWADTESQFRHYTHRMIRSPKYKLIRWDRADKPDELYDLIADPHETKNIIQSPAVRKVRDDMINRLTLWMKKTNDPALKWPAKNGKTLDLAEEERKEMEMRAGIMDKNPVHINPSLLDAYVGQYELVTRNIMNITREGDKLFFTSEFGGKAELIYKGENVFVHKTAPVRFTFVKDATGKITHVIRRNSISDDVKTIDMQARKIK